MEVSMPKGTAFVSGSVRIPKEYIKRLWERERLDTERTRPDREARQQRLTEEEDNQKKAAVTSSTK
mgnify:FL=1